MVWVLDKTFNAYFSHHWEHLGAVSWVGEGLACWEDESPFRAIL